jgi:RNA polymerase sigma-70 factor (ECF subfamily)
MRLLTGALKRGRIGPFQLQAAIAACHASSPTWSETNWTEILALYDMLQQIAPSPVVGLNRAIALAEVAGPERALAEVDALAEALGGYHLFHATRAELLRRLDRRADAAAADRTAVALTRNPAEQYLLRRRIDAGR